MLIRPNTADTRAVLEAYIRNDYFLPRCFNRDDVVIDVGAHIGSFSLAALARGVGCVWSFEADPTNHALAGVNLRSYGTQVHLHNIAVWRSDRKQASVFFSGYKYEAAAGIVNTGGGDVLFADSGPPVPAIAFDDVIDAASDGGTRRIRLVKFDCEGSEFPILLTSERLHLIDEIVGEYHSVGAAEWMTLRSDARIGALLEYRPEDLCQCLEERGFVARLGHGDRRLGQFMAWRQRAR